MYVVLTVKITQLSITKNMHINGKGNMQKRLTKKVGKGRRIRFEPACDVIENFIQIIFSTKSKRQLLK